MKKILYSILLFSAVCTAMSSCSNGDYVANPASNGNNSVNPLNPLNSSQFTWAGADPVSCTINGAPWVADTAYYYMDTSGANIITAYRGFEVINFYFKNTWSGNIYNMGFKQFNVSASYVYIFDSTFTNVKYYSSVLGNSGQMYMINNDTTRFMCKFYAQMVDTAGNIANIANGYINIEKPH